MAAEVKWNKNALGQLQSVLRYGKSAFGANAANKFYQLILSNELCLATNPEMGFIEPLLEGSRRLYRSLVIQEHYKLIYHIDKNKDIIHIVALWDTRKDPVKLADSML